MQKVSLKIILSLGVLLLGWIFAISDVAEGAEPEGVGRLTIPLDQPLPELPGGIFAHDLNGDGRMDLILTSKGHLGAYETSGGKLWVVKCDLLFFEGLHHPSAIAGDLDGDGQAEVAIFNGDHAIEIRNGLTGEIEKTLTDIGQPVAMAIANLRGLGDRDLILQDSQISIRAISADDGTQLWQNDQYRGIEHSPARQADLDGDGLDEVAGVNLVDHDGKLMHDWDLGDAYKAMDSLVIADIIPGLPLEVVLAEQRGGNSHTDLINSKRIVWRKLNPWNWEDPDKLAVGDFDPALPGLEIFNRSSGGDGTAPRGREEPFADEEAPWVFDAQGNLLAKYYLNDKKPDWWTGHGLEEICRIDWDGGPRQKIAGKERHRDGACAIVDPMDGTFEVIFPTQATRVYVADVIGDYREEVIAVDAGGTIEIFSNDQPNPHGEKPRYWEQQHYRRQKQNWNYYSP
jgi:hypothetical protein